MVLSMILKKPQNSHHYNMPREAEQQLNKVRQGDPQRVMLYEN
jgi:hypothetical protein